MSKQINQKQWSFDLTLKENDVGYTLLQEVPPPFKVNKILSLEKQILNQGISTTTDTKQNSTACLALIAKKKQKAMEVALGPGKQIGMNAFMMYMSGKSLNIFSISVTSMALFTPLKSLLSINQIFKPFEDSDSGKSGVDLQMPKLIFVACNLVWFCVGLYKMGSMRLLPTTSADWSGAVVWKEMMQVSNIPCI